MHVRAKTTADFDMLASQTKLKVLQVALTTNNENQPQNENQNSQEDT